MAAVIIVTSTRKCDGRAYLVSDTFTVADLTAAALLGPVLQPPEIQWLG